MTEKFLLSMMVLGLLGCASGQADRVAAPRGETKVYFYVGAEEMKLKSSPDYDSADAGTVKLNERVEKLERGQAGWFLVRTQDGRQGWISEKYLEVDPVSEFFVRRWGVLLRHEPKEQSRAISRLRTNDQVKLLEQTPRGWAKVAVARTQETGWLEMGDLSVERVVIRRVRQRPAAAAKGKAEEAAPPEETGMPPSPPELLGPSPAQAAPPPVKKPSSAPKAQPEKYEPF